MAKKDFDFDALYLRYALKFPNEFPYCDGYREISERDLLNIICADLDDIDNDIDRASDLNNPTLPNVVIETFSVNEANFLAQELDKRLNS